MGGRVKVGGRKVRIGIVCLSAIPDDPRVRRQGDLFAERGWEVLAFGLPGARSVAPDWQVFELEPLAPPPSVFEPPMPAVSEPVPDEEPSHLGRDVRDDPVMIVAEVVGHVPAGAQPAAISSEQVPDGAVNSSFAGIAAPEVLPETTRAADPLSADTVAHQALPEVAETVVSPLSGAAARSGLPNEEGVSLQGSSHGAAPAVVNAPGSRWQLSRIPAWIYWRIVYRSFVNMKRLGRFAMKALRFAVKALRWLFWRGLYANAMRIKRLTRRILVGAARLLLRAGAFGLYALARLLGFGAAFTARAKRAAAKLLGFGAASAGRAKGVAKGVLSRLAAKSAQASAMLRRRAQRFADVARVYVDEPHAAATYWTLNDRFARLFELARPHKVDIWLANDWTALPIAQKLAMEQGVPYAYDTHELAVDEYAQHWRWRVFQRPIIAAVERTGIAGCSFTSCVSAGISRRLHGLYRLRQAPAVIRNMPRYEAHTMRPCGETIEVLYHGVVAPGRGLETCIESVALWRREFRFTIRGPAPAEYLETLAGLIEKHGVSGRVVLAPPVPMIDLVKEASRFDIGLFALPGHSKQNLHVLPNKFFEYTMAGLALCVSDLPEMTALLKKHDHGRLIPEVTAAAIAAGINGFDRASINRYKANALSAARSLNWEVEADRFFETIANIVEVRHEGGPARARVVTSVA
jgi:glycogen synthase